MDQIHVQDQEILSPFRKDVPLQFALNAVREYRQFQKPRKLDQDLLGEFCVLDTKKNRDLASDLCLSLISYF